MQEAALDFYVWVVEFVCEKIRIKILDGQISRLIHECNRCWAHIVDFRQSLHRKVISGNIVEVVIALFQISYQKCRCSSLEPVHPELIGIKCVEKTERVVYARRFIMEMIPVIH